MLFVFLSATLLVPAAAAQSVGGRGTPQEEGFVFQTVAEVPTTPVKDQARTGTCWSFATTSFIETELLRMGNGPLDLSEMYFVRMTYPQKVQNYVRLHGNTTLGQGSLAGDVIRAVRLYGAVPEALYSGRQYGKERHDHAELHAVLKGAVDAVVKTRGGLSPVWPEAVEGILDAYLGEIPETFVYNGKTYTPRSFAGELGIRPDDYVELTSFTHHPFDSWFALEIPDNWARNKSYNVPLEELMGVIDRAVERGFSVDWDGDVSERSFCHDKGVAIWPLNPWDERSSEERGQLCDVPEPEVRVTQELRQRSFDNYTSSDDHLMHIVGIAKDQHGTKYYVTKNSWGETGAKDGFVYMSESYVRAKTMSIVVHRDALPQELARRALRN
ncbi:MAG: aminopeptidase [Gemmatimonadales bacterium]|nr:aminopeptidase [Gemmatimonadales bacterium]NIN13223.1 aminopeptidase [Gemmatimonadales bacterium]NIN51240.1 aminopeptidase [Gemmatimonadales bacterium]NIP08704.1 aminopeptidase [Gemmatimonadales bacterium]NIR00957.1 aminopeptidase [Gemmatimonadales bacterium]